MDIQLLFEKPDLGKEVKLTIEPLAPLSIVNSLPGSYYKSQNKPTKANLCGIFENILGWHIGRRERSAILKKMKSIYRKKYKMKDIETVTSEVDYNSLLGHLFQIELELLPIMKSRYDDVWKQQLKHDDARHLKGTPNISQPLISQKKLLPTDDNGKISDSTYSDFLKKNIQQFPMYYTSPTPREFIVLKGSYQYKLLMTNHLFEALKVAIAENNIAYLGTSEGWINLLMNEI